MDVKEEMLLKTIIRVQNDYRERLPSLSKQRKETIVAELQGNAGLLATAIRTPDSEGAQMYQITQMMSALIELGTRALNEEASKKASEAQTGLELEEDKGGE